MERRPINVRLTPEARAGFDEFCERYDVNLTAFLEQVGLRLREMPEKCRDLLLPPAQEMAEERAKRPGPRRKRY